MTKILALLCTLVLASSALAKDPPKPAPPAKAIPAKAGQPPLPTEVSELAAAQLDAALSNIREIETRYKAMMALEAGPFQERVEALLSTYKIAPVDFASRKVTVDFSTRKIIRLENQPAEQPVGIPPKK